MPAADADHLRDLLVAHGAHTVIEIGLGYGSSALAIGEALWPSVATALRYFDLNLGWQPVTIAGRLTARRVPEEFSEPDFTDFKPFWNARRRDSFAPTRLTSIKRSLLENENLRWKPRCETAPSR